LRKNNSGCCNLVMVSTVLTYGGTVWKKKLFRSQNKVLGGVIAGITEYFAWSVDPNIVRILFALLVLGGFGVGFIAYLIAWIIIPDASAKEL